MIDPYDPSNLKSGSYEVSFSGTIYYWDESGKEQSVDIEKEKKFLLRKNSIAFLFTKTKFRLPDYIALRFNLKITHVHRGILLGTGPLVDPGFEGNLLIPLHNLTTNDYVFKLNEGLIWVEFTKLSPNPRWQGQMTPPKRVGVYKEFLESKKNRDAAYYFGKAAWGRGIRSSIPDAMRKTAEDAEKSRISAESVSKAAKRWSIWTAIGIALAVIGLFISLYLGFQPVLQLVQESTNLVKDKRDSYENQNRMILKNLGILEQKMVQIGSQNKSLYDINRDLEKRIKLLEKTCSVPQGMTNGAASEKN